MSESLYNILLLVPVFLFSLCFHEYAHAWTAFRLGDNTAKRLGRLTLHPLAHADIVGTLILPIICIYTAGPFFGWAKPVPIDPRNFQHPRRDMAIVAFAGPLANIFLAIVSTVVLAFLFRIQIDSPVLESLQRLTVISIQINLFLAVFNMIPVPPLDGSRVLQGMLPTRAAYRFMSLERYGFILLLVLFMTGSLRYLVIPVKVCFLFLLSAAGVTIS